MEILSIGVHPAYWRSGHGEALAKWCIQLGDMDKVPLCVSASPMGIQLMRRIGFKQRKDVPIKGYKQHPKRIHIYFATRHVPKVPTHVNISSPDYGPVGKQGDPSTLKLGSRSRFFMIFATETCGGWLSNRQLCDYPKLDQSELTGEEDTHGDFAEQQKVMTYRATINRQTLLSRGSHQLPKHLITDAGNTDQLSGVSQLHGQVKLCSHSHKASYKPGYTVKKVYSPNDCGER